uniref:Uncharacterized protein n=1 Tax=uncultured bacterium contig00070 TaxID=1181551 RepID=A0A806KK14_9BACT|nr:hypothetical protein [uncultured bacterium contig00070]
MNKVFAGYDHALILKENGDLYGLGSNSSGQLGSRSAKKDYYSPNLVAKNVKAAAAGYNSTVIVDKNGSVSLIGDTELSERFKGFEGEAETVYARPDMDSYCIKDKNEDFYVFGCAAGCKITDIVLDASPKEKEVVLHAFPEEKCIITYRYQCIMTTYGQRLIDDNVHNDEHTQRQKIIDKLKDSQIYKEYSGKYGPQNVKLELKKIKTDIKNKSAEKNIEEETVSPEIHLKTVMIYTPEKYNFEYNISNLYRGCWPIEKINFPLFPSLKKYLEFGRDKHIALYENKNLFVSEQVGIITTIREICNNVEDVSVSEWKSIFIISKTDGTILSGEKLDELVEITI